MMQGCFSGNLHCEPGITDSQKQSPDLYPISNVWSDLKKAVAAQKRSNITELEAFASGEWAKIPNERCKKLDSTY